jgi:probable rRNA maturation factor
VSFAIDIQNEHRYTIDRAVLQSAVETVLKRFNVRSNTSLSVVLTTNEAVQALNRQHRNIDIATDVLSFPAEPLPSEIAEEEAPYLGDLLIAFPYASEQAKKLQHKLEDSFALLVIHGTLHLLGYDHDTPENRAEMWAEQEAILLELGIDTAIVPSLEGGDHA